MAFAKSLAVWRHASLLRCSLLAFALNHCAASVAPTLDGDASLRPDVVAVDVTAIDARREDTTTDTGTIDAPDVTVGLPRGETIAAGNSHTCALSNDGTVRCWGDNARAQLGNGSTSPIEGTSTVLDVTNAVEVAAGVSHACALLGDGTVRCWGYNNTQQLGDRTTSTRDRAVPVVELDDVVQLRAGSWHNCALRRDRTVRCWGSNERGQLGDGSTTMRGAPVEVPGLRDVVEITAGGDMTCARSSDGTVRCWGYIFPGVLAGWEVNTTSPVEVEAFRDAVEIDAGDQHVCVRRADNTARCIGANANGALGDGTSVHRTTPVSVLGLAGVAQLDLGGASCARLQNRTIRCWGAINGARFRATEVDEVTDAIELTVGGQHACARLSDNTIRCWGHNRDGQAMAGGCCVGLICGVPEGAACGPAPSGLGTCAGGWCTGCGDLSEPCCTLARGERCRGPNLTCSGERCQACGRVGELCCDDTRCGEGAVCFLGRCRVPGQPGGPCLANNGCAAGCCVQQEHSTRACVAVGTTCPGTTEQCSADGSCGSCGGADERCCDSDSSRIPRYCSAAGVTCTGERCTRI